VVQMFFCFLHWPSGTLPAAGRSPTRRHAAAEKRSPAASARFRLPFPWHPTAIRCRGRHPFLRRCAPDTRLGHDQIAHAVLVHPLTFARRALLVFPEIGIQLWREFMNPAVNAGIVNINAALFHHFLQAPVAQRISQVPADTDQDESFSKRWPLKSIMRGLTVLFVGRIDYLNRCLPTALTATKPQGNRIKQRLEFPVISAYRHRRSRPAGGGS